MTEFEMRLTQKRAQEYGKADKQRRSRLITEYCELTGVSRNLASKRFREKIRDFKPQALKIEKPKRVGRKLSYTNMHKAIIQKAWELSGEICGERLHPVLGEYLDELEKNSELKYFGHRYIEETRFMSEATVKRTIAGFPRISHKKHKGNAALYKEVPIDAYFGRKADRPGYIEVDYVEHNGSSSKGSFGITGCYVDVCLGWIARYAALGKDKQAVGAIHDGVGRKIPHRVYEYHPDNAPTILGLLLERLVDPSVQRYAVSRSRPYHKEDNGHVEQKNGDKVRKLVGYHRYDRIEQIELLNQLYELEDRISNYFVPSQKLEEKELDERGRVVRRRHSPAKTAYQRLIESGGIGKRLKEQVKKIRNGLSLVELRKQANELQKELTATVISRK